MHMRLSTILFVTMLVGAALLGGCRKTEEADLVLISPHNEFIESEFERAFADWHERNFGSRPTLRWRDMGGTNDAAKFIKEQYEAGAAGEVDVFFGGGAPDHAAVAAAGAIEPIELPAEILAAIPAELSGVQLYDAEAGWYGSALSTFGIFYNQRLLSQRGLPAPVRWSDLAHRRMYNNVIAASPSSGSAKAAYDIIAQSAPTWPEGWAMLMQFWGNCQQITRGSSDMTGLVVEGQAGAGTAIDFYAYTEMAEANTGDETVLNFVAPTAVFTPDPISVLKGAPHPEMARRFVQFVLSEEGQRLWCLPPGSPGGPAEHALYRLPIHPAVYEQYPTAAEGSDEPNTPAMLPFLIDVYEYAAQRDDRIDTEVHAARVANLLPDLMTAAVMTDRELMHRAWGAILDRGMPADQVAEFVRLPADVDTLEKSLAMADRLAQLRQEEDELAVEEISRRWRDFFREKYQGILDR